MVLRVVLILALVAVVGFGIWEVRRWFTPEGREMISPRQRLLRLWGLFFLLATLGLCLGWTYLPIPQTRRQLVGYAQYIILICLAVLPLIPLALLDWRENLRRLAASRKKLLQETLGPLSCETADPPPTTPA
jgi:hypothetical protein